MRQEFYDNDVRNEMDMGGEFAHSIDVMDDSYTALANGLSDKAKSILISSGSSAIGYGKAVAKLMHERHPDDGNLVPAMMGYVEAKALAVSLLQMLASDPQEVVRFLAMHYTIPLNTLCYESVQQELIDKELSELD